MPTILSKRPAARIVLLFVGGILVAQYSLFSPSLLLFLALALLVTGLAFQFIFKRELSASLCFHALVLVAGLVLHAVQLEEIASRRILPRVPNEPIVLRGVVDADPVIKGNSLQLIVKASTVVREFQEEPVDGRVLVLAGKSATSELQTELRTGSNIIVDGTVEPPFRPRNPGEFDYGRYLELNDIVGVLRTKDSSGIHIGKKTTTWSINALAGSVRRSLTSIIEANHSTEEANFLKGVILADRGEITRELKQAFVDTGTIHILAVSGFNVGIVALVFYAVFGLLRIPRKLISVATIVGLFVYMLLTGSTPSVVRATMMASVFLVGKMIERKTDMYNVLAVAALIILVLDTKQLFNVGFQLSFAAVFSMVYLYPVFEGFIRKIPDRFRKIKLFDYTIKLFAVSLAAQLGTIPFTAYYFERISIVSLLANLVVVPVVSVNVILGFATIGCSYFSEWLASGYAALNELLVSLLLRFVTEAARVPFAYFDTAGLGTGFPFFYYVGIGSAVYFNKPRVIVRLFIILLIGLNCFVFTGLVRQHRHSLTLTVLDVGEGDALLVEFPNKKHILLDAGPKTFSYDAGERVIAPFLKRQGIASLEAIILSHPHSDHIGGVQYLLEHFQVAKLMQSERSSDSRQYKELHAVAMQRGVEVLTVKAGETLPFDSTARVLVFHPVWTNDSTMNFNNSSLVVKIEYGSSSFLLMGDAEEEAEQKLVERFAAMLNCDFLKVGHHGSITSSSDTLLQRASPAIAVISVGRYNKFGHPSLEIVARLKQKNIDTKRTDDEGAVILRTDGTDVQVVDWR